MLAALDLKLVIQAGNNQLIPQYLINTLVYFFLKTSKSSDFLLNILENFQMARQLTKYRRLVTDILGEPVV